MAGLKIRGGEPDTEPAPADVGPAAPADARPGARLDARPESEAPAGKPAGRRSRWSMAMAGLTVAFVLLAALDVVLLIAGIEPAAGQRGPALDVAKRVVLDLGALTTADRDARLARLRESTTGPLHAQLDGYAAVLGTVPGPDGSHSDVTVGAAALEHVDERSAVALITTVTAVRASDVADAQVLRHRLAVELHREGGQWLASSLEIVP